MAKQFGSVYFLCDPVLGADPIGAAADWPAREILMDRIHEIIVIDIVLRIRSYPFWAAAPKGTKSCRTQGDFHLFRLFICPSPQALPGQTSALSGLYSILSGLKSALSGLESALSGLKFVLSGLKPACQALNLSSQA